MSARTIFVSLSLVFVMTLAPSLVLEPVSAETYERLWYIYSQGDMTLKRHFADIEVTYSSPDFAPPGEVIEVKVSLTYLKNEVAHMAWIEFHAVAVHLRQHPQGSDLTFALDDSRVTVKPGGAYTHIFAVQVPEEPGVYVLTLTWKTHAPPATAYGLSIEEDTLDWDTSGHQPLPRVKVAHPTLTVKLQNAAAAKIIFDGQPIPVVGGLVEVLLVPGQHSLEVPPEVELAPGARAMFQTWSDGETSNPRQVSSKRSITLVANYKIQYLLTMISDIGDPQGAGWYDAGTEALISVTSPQPEEGVFGALGGKFIFQQWTGDLNTSSPTATIKMDGPKEVQAEWTIDRSQPYMILLGLTVAIIVIVALGLLMRRKAHARPEPTVVTPPAPSAPQPAVQAAQKFCMHCGRAIPPNASFCFNCGKPQE